MDEYPARMRYRGDIAARYLDARTGDRKWQLEQQLMDRLVSALPPRSSVLDVPIGTGRYLPFYTRGEHPVIGLDISPDMLREVRADPGNTFRALIRGDATAIPLRDQAVDYVISTRLMNWLPFPVFVRALREFTRVATCGLILGIREIELLAPRQLVAMSTELATAPLDAMRRLLRPLKFWDTSGILLHRADDVRAAVTATGFAIDDVITIDEGSAFSRRIFRYTPLRVYVLRRP